MIWYIYYHDTLLILWMKIDPNSLYNSDKQGLSLLILNLFGIYDQIMIFFYSHNIICTSFISCKTKRYPLDFLSISLKGIEIVVHDDYTISSLKLDMCCCVIKIIINTILIPVQNPLLCHKRYHQRIVNRIKHILTTFKCILFLP